MRKLGLFVFGMALAALPVTLPSLSWADGPVQLRQEVTVSSGRVTLGDLFADAGEAAGIVVGRVQPGQSAMLDATQVQLIARSNGVNWGNPAGLRRIAVQSSASGPAPAAEPARAAEPKKAAKGPAVLAYLHNLNAGDIVRAEDLTWSREAVAGSDSPRDPEAVIGMLVRRPLREGDPVSVRDVSAPMVIKKDDVISVTFSQAGLNLSLQAKAMGDAAAGQLVAVMNTNSKKVIQAVAIGPGSAVVGPEADQLKAVSRLQSASALSNLSRLAQR